MKLKDCYDFIDAYPDSPETNSITSSQGEGDRISLPTEKSENCFHLLRQSLTFNSNCLRRGVPELSVSGKVSVSGCLSQPWYPFFDIFLVFLCYSSQGYNNHTHIHTTHTIINIFWHFLKKEKKKVCSVSIYAYSCIGI